jgi:hypothetical protein
LIFSKLLCTRYTYYISPNRLSAIAGFFVFILGSHSIAAETEKWELHFFTDYKMITHQSDYFKANPNTEISLTPDQPFDAWCKRDEFIPINIPVKDGEFELNFHTTSLTGGSPTWTAKENGHVTHRFSSPEPIMTSDFEVKARGTRVGNKLTLELTWLLLPQGMMVDQSTHEFTLEHEFMIDLMPETIAQGAPHYTIFPGGQNYIQILAPVKKWRLEAVMRDGLYKSYAYSGNQIVGGVAVPVKTVAEFETRGNRYLQGEAKTTFGNIRTHSIPPGVFSCNVQKKHLDKTHYPLPGEFVGENIKLHFPRSMEYQVSFTCQADAKPFKPLLLKYYTDLFEKHVKAGKKEIAVPDSVIYRPKQGESDQQIQENFNKLAEQAKKNARRHPIDPKNWREQARQKALREWKELEEFLKGAKAPGGDRVGVIVMWYTTPWGLWDLTIPLEPDFERKWGDNSSVNFHSIRLIQVK